MATAETRIPRRIAVVAVHGVGDHPPCASARAVGDLLAGVSTHENRPKYSVFREKLLRLKVRRTHVNDHTKYLDDYKRFTWGPMNAIAAAGKKLSGRGADSVDHLFMEAQLKDFDTEKAEDTYQFLRLDAEQLIGDKHKVHVYEMYWADLSRLGTGFTSIFTELYQLLFHLTSVGVNNISAAAVPLAGDPQLKGALRRWTWLRWLYLAASGTFAWPIAILNLFLAAFLPAIVGISLLHDYLTPAAGLAAVVGLYASVLIAILAIVLLLFRRLGFLWFAAAFLVPLAVGGAVWWNFRVDVGKQFLEFALGIVLILTSALPVGLALQAYERRRPGSMLAGYILAGTCILAAIAWQSKLSFRHAPEFRALLACVNGIEIVFQLLQVAWIAFAIFYLLTLAMGAVATALSPPRERPRAVRTFWTALLALVLPSLLFLVFTLVGWTGILKAVTPLLPNDPAVGCYSRRSIEPPDICYEPMFPAATGESTPGPTPLRHWADAQLRQAGFTILPTLLAALLLALILAVWSFAPSVWDELNKDQAAGQDAGRFGRWLSLGFRFLYPAGWILVAAMTFCMAGSPSPRLHIWFEAHALTANLIGTLVAGAGAGLLAFRGRLSDLALGFRPVVRVMLDVDSWLREHPRDSNPTGRICARYVSLLRHICNYRDPEGRKHDALVIVAHSQGTVITADLLRFLRVEHHSTVPPDKYDPGLERMLDGDLPVYLFTMGCPLRQLYGLRFPYLYEWSHHERGAASGNAAVIPADTKPDPRELGVRAWTNAFRSGDYIGRQIWRSDDYPASAAAKPSCDPYEVRRETCIGAGAHTHYWDESAPEIARILDEIVSRA